ncbi:MAG TPA: polyprenyl diphosphate synthase [Anaerolineae bacterium]|nr:polyprenyl diphosphate synthase [Anaerolineae bacterium]
MDLSEPQSSIPYHVGMIMDGNGRWARLQGLPRLEGHRAGTENIRRVLQACGEYGIKVVTIYAFSTENWYRPREEVRGLMGILEWVLESEVRNLHEQGVKLRHIGELEGLSDKLRAAVVDAIELTKNNDRLILNVAFNYGGRSEIVRGVQRLLEEHVRPDEVDEELLGHYLYTAGLPDPDLIIRTGGEMRLSNFLIWQSAYAEYYSTPTFWPDFDKEELNKALQAYAQRERRFGRLKV